MVRIRQLGLPLGSAFIDPELRTQRTTLSYLDRSLCNQSIEASALVLARPSRSCREANTVSVSHARRVWSSRSAARSHLFCHHAETQRLGVASVFDSDIAQAFLLVMS
jgi:hypothetical protein